MSEADQAEQPATIEMDLPCAQCTYNLRGLDEYGHCPECGLQIVRSIIAYRQKQSKTPDPLESSGAAWLGEQIEGIWVLLLALLLAVAGEMAPYSMYKFHSRSREVLLGLACSRLVLDWFGVWKIAAEVSAPLRPWWRRTGVYLRAIILSFLAFLLLAYSNLLNDISEPVALCIGFGLMGAILVAPVLLFLRLRRLAKRAGKRLAMVLLTLSIPLMAFSALVAVLPQLDGPEDSLSQVRRDPSMAFGDEDDTFDALRWLMSDFRFRPLELGMVALPLIPLIGMVQLLPPLHRARRLARTSHSQIS